MKIDFTSSELLAMTCILECHHDRIMVEYQDCFDSKDHEEFKGLILKCDKTLKDNGIKRDWRPNERLIKEIKKIWDVE